MSWLPRIGNLFLTEQDSESYGMQLFSGMGFGSYKRSQLLQLVIQNPAFVKVIALQCDTFSLGKFYAYKNDNEINIPLLDLLKFPKGTTQSQLLWDYMFWNMLGDVFLWIPNKNFESLTRFYFLNPMNIEFPYEIRQKKIYLSNEDEKLKKLKVTYTTDYGQSLDIPWGEIIHITDLSNTMTKEVFGLSRLDSLYKIILNSEETLKTKNINTKFGGKFLVAGSVDAMDITKRMLSPAEKDDIEKKVLGRKSVHAVKSLVEIKRFVEDMKKMELSKSYLEDYFLIGNMYNIPRDVLEAFNSSTYENQEKSRAMHVSYTCEPKGEALGNALSSFFELKNTKIVLGYDHLNFVQVLEKDKEETKKMKLDNLEHALRLGLGQEEALKFVDLDFKDFKYEKPAANTEITGNTGQEAGQEAGGITEE